MRIANSKDRAVIVLGDEIVDIAEGTDGHFGPDPTSVYEDWANLVDAAASITVGTAPLIEADLRCPVPIPHQLFAIGLNYRSHAEESDMAVPDVPATLTKFPASLSGPFDDIEVVGENIDWEVELVAVMGRRADRVSESEAWSYVAGLTVGQDISDRHLQFAASSQFSLGKSRRGYGPMGSWVVFLDEFPNPDDLALGCSIDGETMQDGRPGDLIVNVPRLIAELSAVLPLFAGDIIFTGTPPGIGMVRQPPRFLIPGDVLDTWIEGIGTMSNHCVANAT